MRFTRNVYEAISLTTRSLLAQRAHVRILMYHRIQARPGGGGYLRPEWFVRHMEYLSGKGFRSYRLCDLRDGWPDVLGGPPAVVLTFDDAWASHVDVVLPCLKEHGFVGTFFVATDHTEDQRHRPRYGGLADFESDLASWADVAKLLHAGMEIGAHTHTHHRLSELPAEQVVEELSVSRRILAEKLGCPVVSMAYPRGDRRSFTDQVVRAAAQAGYQVACTTIWGCPTRQSDLLQLPRIDINGLDDPARFVRKMKGHYDFLRWIRRWR